MKSHGAVKIELSFKQDFPNYIASLKPLKLHKVYSEEELSDDEHSKKVEHSNTCLKM